ncbi:hypothetical protein CCP3SC1_660015 [Gammaproteobacteria bacterium]
MGEMLQRSVLERNTLFQKNDKFFLKSYKSANLLYLRHTLPLLRGARRAPVS